MLKTVGGALLFTWSAACLKQPSSGLLGYASIHIHHIAKTAATSAFFNLRQIVPPGQHLSLLECCWPYRPIEYGVVRSVVTFVRDPKAHVYSQFNHCKENLDNWFKPVGFPATFQDWLQYWVQRGPEAQQHPLGNGFHCYMPHNLQTRALSCTAESCEWATCALDTQVLGESAGSFTLNGTQALDHLKAVSVLGLTEFYQESMCLAYVHFRDELPPWCDCEDEKAWDGFPEVSYTHGSSHKPVGQTTFSAEELGLIQQLTQWDQAVYDAASKRFLAEIADAEQRFGKKILCSGARGTVAAWREGRASLYAFD